MHLSRLLSVVSVPRVKRLICGVSVDGEIRTAIIGERAQGSPLAVAIHGNQGEIEYKLSGRYIRTYVYKLPKEGRRKNQLKQII